MNDNTQESVHMNVFVFGFFSFFSLDNWSVEFFVCVRVRAETGMTANIWWVIECPSTSLAPAILQKTW